jgi:DNA modification methylase
MSLRVLTLVLAVAITRVNIFQNMDMKQEIWHGDCLELMKDIPDGSIDMILCDLPYGVTGCKWDTVIPFEPLWKQYNRIIKQDGAIALFGSQPFTSALVMSNPKMFKYEWIWLKGRGQNFAHAKKQPMRGHESILVFYLKQPTYNPIMTEAPEKNIRKPQYHTTHFTELYNVNKMPSLDYDPTKRYPLSYQMFSVGRGRDKKHPNEKPVELLEYLIKTYTNEGDLVLDNCAGSGSTLVAAKNLNRQFIGIEKEEKYYNICLERLK